MLSNLIGSEVLFFLLFAFIFFSAEISFCKGGEESTVGEPPSQEPIRLRQCIFSCSDDTEYLCGIKCVPKIVSFLEVCLPPDLVKLIGLLLYLFVVVFDGFNPSILAVYHLKS